MRIGQGFDVHRFAPDRPLILGGIQIPFGMGLSGHSDADVLLHAIADAILGAIGLGDIGLHFPDNDTKWRGADSHDLLKAVMKMAIDRDLRIFNLDATVICEEPRIRPYVEQMRSRIADALSCKIDQVNLKGTTTEKLGFCGRKEGIAASAVVLLG